MNFPFFGEISLHETLRNPTIIALLVANIVSIIFAVIFNWSLLEVFLVYWIQSCIIGFFHFFKIAFAKNFSLDGESYTYTGSGRTKVITSSKQFKAGSVFSAFFFAFVWGFFHIIYLVFIIALFTFSASDFFAFGNVFDFSKITAVLSSATFFFTIGIFFLVHLFSFIYYFAKERQQTASSSEELFSQPFSRIIPMHLGIIAFGILLQMKFNPIILIIIFALLIKSSKLFLSSDKGRKLNPFVIVEAIIFLVLFIGIFYLSQSQITILALIIFLLIKLVADIAGHAEKHSQKPKTWLEEFEQNNPPTSS